MTFSCLACFEGISMPGDNKVCSCSCAQVSGSVGSLLPSWTKNWGSSRTDVQDWNICPFSPWLLLLKQVKNNIIMVWQSYSEMYIDWLLLKKNIKSPIPKNKRIKKQKQLYFSAVAHITNNYNEIRLVNLRDNWWPHHSHWQLLPYNYGQRFWFP